MERPSSHLPGGRGGVRESSAMRGSRIVTLVAFAGIFLVALLAAIERGHSGYVAASIVPLDAASNTRFVVRSAPQGDPLHRGDRIEITDPATLAALEYHDLRVGATIEVLRISPLPQVVVREPIVGSTLRGVEWLVFAIQAMFVAIAALIAARGRANGSQQLAWFFVLLVLTSNPTTISWPLVLVIVYAVVGGALTAIALLCASEFTWRFTGDSQGSWARRYRAVARGTGVVAIASIAGVSWHSLNAATTPVFAQNAVVGLFVVQAALFLLGLGVGYARASRSERQRIVWIVGSLGIGIVALMATIFLNLAGIPEPVRDLPLLALAVMPLGCAYAILRYRLLDVGFVVNRATVFAITSILVLAALALVDYGLQSLLGSWLRETGIVVQLGLALVIGISTRPLHGRIDTLVDDLFFRSRNEAVRALRHFARDVAFIDRADVAIERTVETIGGAARLDAALYLVGDRAYECVATSERGNFATGVDPNDVAVVRLLATREHVDLHGLHGAVAGDFAFPMFARNRLLGFLTVAGKVDGAAAYAPDELAAIGEVARATGLALDLLRVEALERELAEMRASGFPVRPASLRGARP